MKIVFDKHPNLCTKIGQNLGCRVMVTDSPLSCEIDQETGYGVLLKMKTRLLNGVVSADLVQSLLDVGEEDAIDDMLCGILCDDIREDAKRRGFDMKTRTLHLFVLESEAFLSPNVLSRDFRLLFRGYYDNRS